LTSHGGGTVVAVIAGAFGAILAALGVLEQFAILTAAQLDNWSFTDLYVVGGVLVVVAIAAYATDSL